MSSFNALGSNTLPDKMWEPEAGQCLNGELGGTRDNQQLNERVRSLTDFRTFLHDANRKLLVLVGS